MVGAVQLVEIESESIADDETFVGEPGASVAVPVPVVAVEAEDHVPVPA